MSKRTNFFIIIVSIVILIFGILFYFSNFNLKNFNFFLKDKFTIPLTTATGKGESMPAIWVWLGSTKVVNESGIYYLQGNIGDKRNLPVKVFLGTEITEIGYASSNSFGTKDAKFPEEFPEWSEQKISKIEVDSSRSKYSIVKILVAPIVPLVGEECDEYCNTFINKQVEYLQNNQEINSINERDELDNITIGPAIQILQILDI